MNKDLIASMRDLYMDMGKTTEGLPPIRFLQILRQVEPRFAEVRQGAYAQQGPYSNSTPHGGNPNARAPDADECWVQILNSLSNGPLSGLDVTAGVSTTPNTRFVDQFLAGEMTKTYKVPLTQPGILS